MSPDYEAQKRRYVEEIIQRINENPQPFLDLDRPSERRGRPAKAKRNQAARNGTRGGRTVEASEAHKAFKAGVYDGFTFNARDEISAAMAAIPAWFDDRDAGDLYDGELKRIRAEAGYLQQQHPKTYLAGEIVGSIVQPANYTGVGWAARGAGLAGRVGRAAALGAGNAGAHGFMAGSGGIDDRLETAGRDAIKGALAGAALGVPLHGYKAGSEISFGPNFRIAPFGNRTGDPLGELPHYHRRGPIGPNGKTISGQGIGRHRPWEKKSSDKSFRDRF